MERVARPWVLGDERGGALESVVSRLKVLSRKPSLQGQPLGSVRFVACSATVPNLKDVGHWLQAGGRAEATTREAAPAPHTAGGWHRRRHTRRSPAAMLHHPSPHIRKPWAS
jgi:hypothetical protein